MKKIFLTLAILAGIISSAQVKIGDNVTSLNASSLLELESTSKGILFPRVTLTSTSSFSPLAAHVAGMVVYNTVTIGDVTPGLYTNNGVAWVKNEAAAITISTPTWRNDASTNVLILATDGNNFVRITGTASYVTFPAPTGAMLGKIFTVLEATGTSAAAFVTAGGVYKGNNVPNVNPWGGYQFVTDGIDWYNIGSN